MQTAKAAAPILAEELDLDALSKVAGGTRSQPSGPDSSAMLDAVHASDGPHPLEMGHGPVVENPVHSAQAHLAHTLNATAVPQGEVHTSVDTHASAGGHDAHVSAQAGAGASASTHHDGSSASASARAEASASASGPYTVTVTATDTGERPGRSA